jgi:hypothetical protein
VKKFNERHRAAQGRFRRKARQEKVRGFIPSHPDEGMKTDVEPPKRPAPVNDSRKRLEAAAAERGKPFSFHDDAEAQLLVDLVKDWDEAGGAGMSDRLRELLRRREQVRALGAEVTAFELTQYDDSPAGKVTPRQWPQFTLRVLVQTVAEVWREHGGKGTGSYYNPMERYHDGPLVRLLLELFEQAGVSTDRRPSRHTLHGAIRAGARTFPR